VKKRLWTVLVVGCLGLGWGIVSLVGQLQPEGGSFDSIVIDFREDAGGLRITEQLERIAQVHRVRPHLNSEFSEMDHIYVIDGDRQILKTLQNSPTAQYAEFIEPNYLYSIPEASQEKLSIAPGKDLGRKKGDFVPPNDPLYPQQWNLKAINIEPAWAVTRGKGVTVAVIDTGVAKVTDLDEERMVAGYDFINDEVNASDDQGHGTHMAGTIAQITNNGYGTAGIASAANIMPIKVLTVGGNGTVADLAEGIRLAADRGAQVIALGCTGNGHSRLLQQAISYANNKGLVIFAPVGNDNQSLARYPARYPHVIGVTATSPQGSRSIYANFGAWVDLAAPGGELSTGQPGGIVQNTFDFRTKESLFAPYQGTSFAVAHASGVAALIRSIKPYSPQEVASILFHSADAANRDPLNEMGWGKLNAGRAIELTQKPKSPDLPLSYRLNDGGMLPASMWLDGQMIPTLEKFVTLGMALVAGYLMLRRRLWHWSLLLGLLFGSCGLFFLEGVYVRPLPQWPLRLLGSALPEVGQNLLGSSLLEPVTASLLPLGILMALTWRWLPGLRFTVGAAVGMAMALVVAMAGHPQVQGIPEIWSSRGFLGLNGILSLGLAYWIDRQRFVKAVGKRSSKQAPPRSRPIKAKQTPVDPVVPNLPSPKTDDDAN
jgi:serine protease